MNAELTRALSSSENSTTVRANQDAAPKPKARKSATTPPAIRALRVGLGALSRLSPRAAGAAAERLFLTPRKYTRPAAEVEALGSARHTLVPSAYGPLAAWEWGSDGPRVLLVHGWEGRGAQLSAFVAPLVERGFRVITFDAPAHGDTEGSISSFFHFAASIRTVASAFGPFHAVVAHSMGGATTLWAASLEHIAPRYAMIAPPVDVRDFTRALAKMLGLPEEVRADVHVRLAERFGVSVEDVRAETVAPRMTGELLVVHDEDDTDVPIRCGELMAKTWPGARLERTKGLGHRRILRDEAVVSLVTRFVARP
jgi:pimeloyl-ACP methyl ester carboxylesterase